MRGVNHYHTHQIGVSIGFAFRPETARTGLGIAARDEAIAVPIRNEIHRFQNLQIEEKEGGKGRGEKKEKSDDESAGTTGRLFLLFCLRSPHNVVASRNRR